MIVLCAYDKPCDFLNKETLECNFNDLCNQQAKPYCFNGDTYFLRRSDLILFVLAKQHTETIIEEV